MQPHMMSLPNILSLLRAPLALVFLSENIPLRITAIILAMLTDSIDGFLARRMKSSSNFGAILDPAMDKFFVFFALFALLYERALEPWQACSMLARDFAGAFFGAYLVATGKWDSFKPTSIILGKFFTALQFFVLIALSLKRPLPAAIYCLFIAAAIGFFLEHLLRSKK